MRIAVFTDRFYPEVDGVSVHVESVVNELYRRGHSLLIISPQPKRKQDQKISRKRFTVCYLPNFRIPMSFNPRVTFPFSLEVLAKVKAFNPDICHFHLPFLVGFQGVIIAKLLNIPLVGTFHSYFMEPEYLQSIGLHKIHLDQSRVMHDAGWNYANFFYNRADMVITPSKCTKSDLERKHIKSPIEVISNGILLDQEKKTSRTLTFDLPKKYFLYVGRLSIEKSLQVLIKAFASVAYEIEEDLLLVGDGPERKNLEKLVSKYALSDRIHFSGEIQHKELVSSNVFERAIAFITPSTSETQCISVLEAMASDLPIIGVRARALTELIEKNGILCTPGDAEELGRAMKKMVTDRVAYRNYCKESKRMIQKHSFAKSVDKLEKLYSRVLREREVHSSKNGTLHPKEFLEDMVKFLDF